MASQPLVAAAQTAPAIRLAGEKDPAADLYNAYHYVTQISGLYAQAGQVDQHHQAQHFWSELIDLAMVDLGELFLIWEEAATGDRGGAGRPYGVDDPLRRAVICACQRASLLIDKLGLWTPVLSWTRILRLAERRWQRLLDRLVIARPLQAEKLRALRAASELRIGRLTARLELYLTEQLRMHANYQKATSGLKK